MRAECKGSRLIGAIAGAALLMLSALYRSLALRMTMLR